MSSVSTANAVPANVPRSGTVGAELPPPPAKDPFAHLIQGGLTQKNKSKEPIKNLVPTKLPVIPIYRIMDHPADSEVKDRLSNKSLETLRALFATALIRAKKWVPEHSIGAMTYYLSLTEALFPGLLAAEGFSKLQISPDWKEVTGRQIHHLFGSDPDLTIALGLGSYKDTDKKDEKDEIIRVFSVKFEGVIGGLPRESSHEGGDTFDGLPGFPPCPEALELMKDVYHVFGGYGILTYASTKPISDENISGFTTNRVRAVLSKVGGSDDKDTSIFANEWTSAGLLRSVQGAFNTFPAFRLVHMSQAISWVDTIDDPRLAIISISVKLLQGIGMTHVLLISDLLVQYGKAIQPIPALASEATRFVIQHQSQIYENTDRNLVYLKALYGDKKTLLGSSQFPELLKIARLGKERVDSRYRNYAPALGVSRFQDTFEEACKRLSLGYPTEKLGESSEIEEV